MARKTLAKYLFDEKMVKKNIWKMFAQCLKSYFELFSPKNCSSHQSSHLSDPPFTFFAQTFANI